MQTSLTLYHYWRSSCSWRVRWALDFKQIPYHLHAIDLLKSEQKEKPYNIMNPSEFVPTLVIANQNSTQPTYLAESLAIIEWLEETWPSPALLPSDAVTKAKCRQLAYTIACGTQPLQNLEAQKYHSNDLEKRKAYAQYWIHKGLASYEKQLVASDAPFSIGGQLSLADLCLIPQVYNALRFEVDLLAFPQIERIYTYCRSLPHCASSAPEAYQP